MVWLFNLMSDSSPVLQRRSRGKPPVITTSQDSPAKSPSKKPVPPSPGSSVQQDVALRESEYPIPSPPNVQPSPAIQNPDASRKIKHRVARRPLSPDGSPIPSPPDVQPSPAIRNPDASRKIKKCVARRPHSRAGSPIPSHPAVRNSAACGMTQSPIPSPPAARNTAACGRIQNRRSRRQEMLDNPFLDLQAVEGDAGNSVDGSENSEDDACQPPFCCHISLGLFLICCFKSIS